MDHSRKTHVSIQSANVVGLILLVAVGVLVWGTYTLVWGPTATRQTVMDIVETNTFVFLGILFGSIIIHELLHGIGFRIGGLRWRDIKFGVFWQMLTPYATSKSAMPVRTYRLATALPGVLLGVVPTVIAIATRNGPLAWYGAFMTAAAGGDAIVLWITRHLPGDVMIRDCTNAVGCEVLQESQSEAEFGNRPANF